MINQKQLFTPKVGVVPVTSYDAKSDFTTEFIEFPNSQKDWSVEFTINQESGAPADMFAIDNEGAHLTDGVYLGLEMTNGAVVDITVATNIVTVVTLVSGGSGYIDGNIYNLVLPLDGTPIITQPLFKVSTIGVIDSLATLLVCNTFDGAYKYYKTASTNVSLATDQTIFDSIMPFRFMKIAYQAETSTGKISINVSK